MPISRAIGNNPNYNKVSKANQRRVCFRVLNVDSRQTDRQKLSLWPISLSSLSLFIGYNRNNSAMLHRTGWISSKASHPTKLSKPLVRSVTTRWALARSRSRWGRMRRRGIQPRCRSTVRSTPIRTTTSRGRTWVPRSGKSPTRTTTTCDIDRVAAAKQELLTSLIAS